MSGCCLHNGAEYLEAMLACYKLRAVPSTSTIATSRTSWPTCSTTPTGRVDLASPFASRIDAVRTRAPDLRVVVEVDDASDVHAATDGRAVREVLASGRRSRLPATLGRRPLRPVHRRHDRPAQRCRVATGRHLLRRARRRKPGWPADRTTRRHRPVGRREPGRASRAPSSRREAIPPDFVSLGLGPLMHAGGQWSALGTLLGGGHAVIYTDAHMDMTEVLRLIERERIVALNLVGDPSGRPLLAALATRARRGTTRRRCSCSVRAAACCRPT